MYKDLIDFLRLRLDILEVHELLDQIDVVEDIPNVNPHLGGQIETSINEFVEKRFVGGASGEQFIESIDIKELLENL